MRHKHVKAGLRCFLGLLLGAGLYTEAVGSEPPAWLTAHVGEGEGQIARPVLERARALYERKLSEGAARNPCYFAMDATRPNEAAGEGGRFYVICEPSQSLRVFAAGHGAGRDLPGAADFHNERRCARNFGNANGSNLTAGGAYVTGASTSSFKGYFRDADGRDAPLVRTFLQFDGEGETANARQRAIGGHAAVTLKGVCLRREPSSPYANREGYVPFGQRVDYTGGRSDGCTSWSPRDAEEILLLMREGPTTLYIYPASADVVAVERAVAAGRSMASEALYWSASCLQEVHAPKFWARETLEPVIAEYARSHPAPPPSTTPICKEH